ncbi:MAG: sugar ABC transporter ATP-binding protein, partial [Clostridia bacterium]|nr:sugar ABC transporter ATP-binding protein [Clostridia bacterium]
MGKELLLQARGIRKEFPGVIALDNVDLELYRGEVLALMGENGAGKSTLIKIFNGVYSLDSGEILIDGQRVIIDGVQKAVKHGITAVHQELNLIPYISVAENIFLGRYPKDKFGTILWNKLFLQAQQILDDLGVPVKAQTELYTLNTALQQMVAISRAISSQCKVLVLDEPTSSLDDMEVRALFNVIHKLKGRGVGIIFITHRLNEIYQVSDRVTILKDGRLVGSYNTNELTMEDLVNNMVGRKINNSIRNKGQRIFADDDYILKVSHIARAPKVRDVSFNVHRGEILGITGLLGSGRSETAEVIFGCEEMDDGEMEYDGKKIDFMTPQKAVNMGMAFCTEDRRGKGIVARMSVMNNIVLASLKSISNGIVVNGKKRNE